MWGLLAGVAGVVMLVAVHLRRRAARRKRIDVGAVSEGWVAQQRGNSDPEG